MASLAAPSSSRISPAVPPPTETGRRALDAELIRRTLSGDDTAARELHRHYRPIVASFLRKLGTQPHELEDTCQDVFTLFFRHLASFRGEAELKTWVFRLCASEARKARRRRRIGATLVAVLRRQPADDVVAPAVKSDATIRELATRALDRMTPEQRLAFVLFEVEGLRGKQVAEVAGKSMAWTFRRLYEAQRIFRETLGIEQPHGDGT
jgi:RNA polymerase sigma-70 factor, ECF subfamily